LGLEPKLLRRAGVGIQIYTVPSLQLVILFPSTYVKRTLVRSLGFAQMLSDLRDEDLLVLYILFRRRTGVDGSLLGLS